MFRPNCPNCHSADVKSIRVWRISAMNFKATELPKDMWACSDPLCLFIWEDQDRMFTDRQRVSDYFRACEALMNSSELSHDEQELSEEMTSRVCDELFPSGINRVP